MVCKIYNNTASGPEIPERTVTSVLLGSQVCSIFGGQLFTKPGHWYILPSHASLGTPGWRRPAPSSEPKEKVLRSSQTN